MMKQRRGTTLGADLLLIHKGKRPSALTVLDSVVDNAITDEIRLDKTRKALFQSQPFREVMRAILALQPKDARARKVRLLNALTPYALTNAERAFMMRGQKIRLKEIATILRKAAMRKTLRQGWQRLYSGDRSLSPQIVDDIVQLVEHGNLEAALLGWADNFDAAARAIDESFSLEGMDTRSLADGGVSKSTPGRAALTFVVRELNHSIPRDFPGERWATIAKLINLGLGKEVTKQAVRSAVMNASHSKQ